MHRYSSEDMVHAFLGFGQFRYSPKGTEILIICIDQYDNVDVFGENGFHVCGRCNGPYDRVVSDDSATFEPIQSAKCICERHE